MKINKLLLSLTLVSIISSANLPIDSSINIRAGYQSNNIYRSELQNLGLQKFLKEEAKSMKYDAVSMTASLDVSYKKSFDKNYLIAGLGASLDYNISQLSNSNDIVKAEDNLSYEIEKKSNILNSLLESKNQLDEEYEKFILEYNMLNKEMKDIIAEIAINEDNIKSAEQKDEELKELKEKYSSQEDIDALEVEINEKKERISQIDEEIKELDSKIQEITNKSSRTKEDNINYEKYLSKRKNLQKNKEELSFSIVDKQIEYQTIIRYDEAKARNDERKLTAEASIEILNSKKDEMKEKYEEIAGTYDEDENTFEGFEEMKESYTEKFESIKNKIDEENEEYLDLIKKNKENNEIRNFSNNAKTLNTVGGSIYANVGYKYKFKEDFYLITAIKLGLNMEQSLSYSLAKKLENNEVVINDVKYVVPINANKIKYSPKIDVSVGIEYNNFRFSVYSSYRTFVGIELGYRF